MALRPGTRFPARTPATPVGPAVTAPGEFEAPMAEILTVPEDPDSELVSRLRVGDEGAFAELAGKYQGAMSGYVPSGAVAEEVVQDAWVGVLRGIDRFERRSSFRTWLFRILVNRAISAGVRERRSVPVDDMGPSSTLPGSTRAAAGRCPPSPGLTRSTTR
jgi:hypothetical protein